VQCRGVLDTTFLDNVSQWPTPGRWFLWVLRFPPPIQLAFMKQLKYCWKWC